MLPRGSAVGLQGLSSQKEDLHPNYVPRNPKPGTLKHKEPIEEGLKDNSYGRYPARGGALLELCV